jgi:hypothetical protein
MTRMHPFLLALTCFLLMAPNVAQAQPWTAAAGAGVVDESALGIYQADEATLGYNASGSTNPIVAYYNVTDTSGTGNPPWTSLELHYYDNFPDSSVRATLIRILGGVKSTVAICTSVDSTGTVTCPLGAPISLSSGALYVLSIRISRSNVSSTPMFTGARLY